MIELLNKLNNINFEELDIDEFLNKRDIEPFDSNWVRVYQIIEELKKGRTIDSTRDIEKKYILLSMNKQEITSWLDIFLMILV
ncbi:hypothetical protein ACR75C_17520 [Thomasclavelia ramosa]|uniref:hypothetical protein n=1 Tax=Thomasclavelia ramosa TaxID=1547 RepID=UPI003DA321EB